MEKSKKVFGNELPLSVYHKAVRNKEKFMRKYGDDSDKIYHLDTVPAPAIGNLLGVKNIIISDKSGICFNEKSIVIGNIQSYMGTFGELYAVVDGWNELFSYSQSLVIKFPALSG